ncbi:putative cleavage induced protein [Achlya hypogyna]|uniref:Putative cleavage induced protein n=1 Tax=Achlya hypogyna TaxID=1202772 RepID=A0A1V9YKD6_ACHHY|nr:putative cleavage induced protein [Achlya hypogyna]
MGFAHPSLVSKLKYSGLSLFIDGTFRVCPKPFVQCVIVMMYNPAYDSYLPVISVLMDAKDNWAYWEMLHQVKIQCIYGEQIQRAMEPGVMDDFTVIPPEEIPEKGIAYVKSLPVITEDHGRQRSKFWGYFKDTWLKQSTYRLGMSTSPSTQPFEKYNRDFGDKFPAAHPGLLSFTQVTKEDANNCISRLNDIM